MTTAKIALVGDRSPSVRAHGRIPLLIDALRRREGLVLDPYWIPSTEAEDLEGFDGIWVVPGSPYRDPEKVVDAVGTAREQRDPVPRHLRRLPARDPAPRARPRRDRARPPRGVRAHRDRRDRAARVLAGRPRGPDHLHAGHADGADRRRRAQPRALPLRLRHRAQLRRGARSGRRRSSAPTTTTARRARWSSSDHPFFLGTLFQPELAGDGTRAHPVIRAFAEATSLRARGRSSRASLPA